MNLKNTLTLKIDSLTYSGGRGVGRSEGLVVFVPGTAPGDVVKIRVTARKPRFLEGEILEIVEPSPSRRKAPCPVFGRCGGCSWQHIDYATQVQQKQKILQDSLKKIERLRPFQWLEFIAATGEFHYRNRIQLQVRDGKFGFYARGSNELVRIEECWIAESKINERLKKLSREELSASRLEIAVGSDGEVILMAEKRDPEAALFSQVNSRQNEKLIESMLRALNLAPQWAMDLYCGSGNLTLPMAEMFPQVSITAVDLSRFSIDRAPVQANIKFIAGDVARTLRSMSPQAGDGLIVLDPPRTGCDRDVVNEVLRHKPKQIVYVSCNPTTFARDAERLMAGERYYVDSVQGLDMFPQTEHVELIASLCAAT